MIEKTIIKAAFMKDRVLTESSSEAQDLFNKSRFGTILKSGRVQLTLIEALYLLEKERLTILDGRNKEITLEPLTKKSQRLEKNFWTRYCVYKDMRNRGYIVKTALKFGADFRVYARGIKPGEDHAKWILYPVRETSSLTWYEFSAKNRVAHSTRKKLLIGVVDEENDVTYWEIRWTKP